MAKPYVNSGTLAGSAQALTTLLKAIGAQGAPATCGPDDQRAFHRAFLEGVEGVAMAVDYDELLFHTLHGELRDLYVSEGGQLEVRTAKHPTPAATHGNAGDGKQLIKMAFDAWQKRPMDVSFEWLAPAWFSWPSRSSRDDFWSDFER